MAKEPSSNMKRACSWIEGILKIKCQDRSFDGMMKFIGEHIDEAKKNTPPPPPSKKQLDLIEKMEAALDIPFNGKTVADASAYITANMAEFKAQQSAVNDAMHRHS